MDDVIHALAFAREGAVDDYHERALHKRLSNLAEKAHEIKDSLIKTIK